MQVYSAKALPVYFFANLSDIFLFLPLMKAWIYILVAVVLQTLWGIVLKVLDFKKVWAHIKVGDIFNMTFVQDTMPLVLYLILGLVIAIVISKAYKLLPMSIVYAAWMGLTLALQVMVDVFLYDEKMKFIQYFFILMILVGILGMKLSNPKSIHPVDIEIDGMD